MRTMCTVVTAMLMYVSWVSAGLVASQDLQDPTVLRLEGITPLSANMSTDISLLDVNTSYGTKAASYSTDISVLRFATSDSSSLINPSEGMLHFWLNTGTYWVPAGSQTTARCLLGEGGAFWSPNSFSLFREVGGDYSTVKPLIFRIYDGSNQYNIDTPIPSSWQSNEWHHIGLSWKSGEFMKIYLDGVLVSTLPSCGTPSFSDTQLYVGNVAGSWQGCSASDGAIYALTIYNGVTYEATVMSDAAASLPVPPKAATPVFKPSGPYISGPTEVTISCNTVGSLIYYTTNGDVPTTGGTAYSSPAVVTVNTGESLQAVAIASGYRVSDVAGMTFLAPWKQLPLQDGGEGFQVIQSICYAPSNANIVYFVSDTSRVWKSIDGGETWAMKHKGFSAHGGNSLAVNPTDPDTVLVAAYLDMGSPGSDANVGIFRTTDGGEDWALVQWIAYSKALARGQFAFANATTVYAATDSIGLLKSTDNGATWNSVYDSGNNVLFNGRIIRDVRYIPSSNPMQLVVCVQTDTNNPNGLYLVTDYGMHATATVIGTNLPAYPAYPLMTAIHPILPNIIYVAIRPEDTSDDSIPIPSPIPDPFNQHGLFKSTDGGANFTPVNDDSDSENITTLVTTYQRRINFMAISPSNPDCLYLTFYHEGLAYTRDGGTTWNWSIDSSGRLIGNYYKSALALSPTDSNVAMIGGDGDKIQKTTDGGNTWAYSNSGYTGGACGQIPGGSDVSCMAWDMNNPQRFILFLVDVGPWMTEDGGSTFESMNVPFPPHVTAKTTLAGAIDPTPNSQTVITAVGNWSSQMIAVTNDNGDNWTYKIGTEDCYSFIAFSPNDANIVYAGKFKSTDKGQTWNTIIFPNSNVTKVATIYPKATGSDIIYAVDFLGTSETIYKSTDGGVTWTSPYPSVPTTLGKLIVDASNPDKLYVAVDGYGIGIINGSNPIEWKTNGLTYLYGSLATRIVAVDPINPNIMYASQFKCWIGQDNGIFRTMDYGETWENITTNLGPDYFSVISLNIHPLNGNIYVGSYHGTWWQSSPGLQALYTFDDGTAYDATTHHYHGTLDGPTATDDGVIRGALSFDGIDDSVSIPKMNYDELSLSAWFYKNSNDTVNADAIIGGWYWNSNIQLDEGFDIRFYPLTPNVIEFILFTKDSNGVRTCGNASYDLGNSVGRWFHVAGTYNKTTGLQKLYINGQLVDTESHPAGNVIVPLAAYSDMAIGYSRTNVGYFNGIIDEVRVYDRPLSDQEVLYIYDQ